MILVIDQNTKISDLFNGNLKSSLQVFRVSSVQSALKFIKKGGVDLIILCPPAPDTEGIQVLKNLSQKAPSVPVIFVAYSSDKSLILSVFRFGAKDFLERPVQYKYLCESIHRIIECSIDKKLTLFHLGKYFGLFRSKVKDFFSSFFPGIPKNSGSASLSSKPLEIGTIQASQDLAILFSSGGNAHTERKQPVSPEVNENNIIQLKQNCKKQALKTDPHLRVYYLGAFQVILNQRIIETWHGRKGKMLFAYLVANHKKHIYRDILMERFWPDTCPSSARNSLNVAMHHVRSGLKKVNPSFEHICFQDDCYFLNPEMDVWLDTEDFYECWSVAKTIEIERGLEAAVEQYESALKSYKGAFMEEDLYETWPSSERENFKEIYMVILDRLSKYYSSQENPLKAILACKTILSDDNCREDIHRRLMRCYYKLGQRGKALQQFKKCVGVLAEELEVKPTSSTIELYQQMKGNNYHYFSKK